MVMSVFEQGRGFVNRGVKIGLQNDFSQ